MSKKFMFNLVLSLTAVTIAVLWLLSMFLEPLENFDIIWVAAILSGVAGLLFILRGLFSKNVVSLKKVNIFFGAGLLVITLLSVIRIINTGDKYVLPIIAIIATAALLLGVIATGGKRWDTGDNQKVGYKNYYQRKAEEEKRQAEEKKDK